MKNLKCYLILIFFSIVSSAKATESPNYPIEFIINDTIKVISIPFHVYSEFGETTFYNLKTKKIIRKINRYFNSQTTFSENSEWIINFSKFGVNIYNNGISVKSYSKSEFIDPEKEYHTKFPDGEKHMFFGDNWYINYFVKDNSLYIMLIDGNVAKINLNNQKEITPKSIDTLSFDGYQKFKESSVKVTYSIDQNYIIPSKEDFEKFDISEKINDEIHKISKDQVSISFIVYFDKCEPKIIAYEELKSSRLYLLPYNDSKVKNTKNYKYYSVIRNIIENKDNWNCSIKNSNWSLSYIIQNKKSY